MSDTLQVPMDNSELLKQLIAEQRHTNRLLAMQEMRARQEKYNADRAKIAEREGVDPSQVLLDDEMYMIARKPKVNE